MRQKTGIFLVCALWAMLVMVIACVVPMVFGFEPPAWLWRLVILILAGAGMMFGFSALHARGAEGCQALTGTVMIMFGMAAMVVSPSLVVASLMMGAGFRHLWSAANELEEKSLSALVRRAGTEIVRRSRDVSRID